MTHGNMPPMPPPPDASLDDGYDDDLDHHLYGEPPDEPVEVIDASYTSSDGPQAGSGAVPPPSAPTPPDQHDTRSTGRHTNARSDTLQQQAVRTIRRVLASMHGKPAGDLTEMIEHVRANPRVLSSLDEDVQDIFEGLLEALDHTCAHISGDLDLTDVPIIDEFDVYDHRVCRELGEVRDHLGTHQDGYDPQLEWFTLVETVQRDAARRGYIKAVGLVDAKAPARQLMEVHRELELPTTKGGGTVGDAEPLTADEWELQITRQRAGSQLLRVSSGYRTLDLSATSPGEPLGWITVGELNIKAAGTGQGKSSDASIAVPAAAQDLVNWGMPQGKVLLLHSEEEEEVKMTQMQLWSGMRHHHLRRNIAIRKVGTRLQRAAEAIYDTVIRAMKEARGGDIIPYLPHVCYVDYIQALKADANQVEHVAVAQSANFFLYGLAAWDFTEMALYSGVDFREYAGMALPDGMDHHRVAVVCYAQLIKQSGERQWFRPDARSTPIGDFVVEGPSGEPGWEVQPGDLRVPSQDEVRGGGQLLQHASNLIFLHRSKPNQPVIRPKEGPAYLADPRARFILSKTRNGADMAFVPMRFSSNPNPGVNKGQYFDFLAEDAMAQGRFRPDASWSISGDPIVPRRADANPLAGVRY